MNKSISIDFGSPEHGWLPVNLHYDDFQLSFHASDVLNDPLDELLKALLELDSKPSKEIVWWMEPGAYFFHIVKNGSEFMLTISETKDLHRNRDKKNIIKTIGGSNFQIIEPFKNALLQFCSKAYEEKDWPYVLDKNKLKRL